MPPSVIKPFMHNMHEHRRLCFAIGEINWGESLNFNALTGRVTQKNARECCYKQQLGGHLRLSRRSDGTSSVMSPCYGHFLQLCRGPARFVDTATDRSCCWQNHMAWFKGCEDGPTRGVGTVSSVKFIFTWSGNICSHLFVLSCLFSK